MEGNSVSRENFRNRYMNELDTIKQARKEWEWVVALPSNQELFTTGKALAYLTWLYVIHLSLTLDRCDWKYCASWSKSDFFLKSVISNSRPIYLWIGWGRSHSEYLIRSVVINCGQIVWISVTDSCNFLITNVFFPFSVKKIIVFKVVYCMLSSSLKNCKRN